MGQVLKESRKLPGSYISALKFREDGIWLNGKPARVSQEVLPGGRVSVRLDDEGGRNEAEPMEFAPDFVYEDEYLAVLNKPAGMAVHGSLQGSECTVANALAFLWGSGQAFHPVNRLDKGTSGLMLIAKSGCIHDMLRRALHTEDFVREYLAVAEGLAEETEGEIALPIGSGEGLCRAIRPDGQPSLTRYKVLWTGETGGKARTLFWVRPLTGRTHQIRVHMAASGHPLCGDAMYGAAEACPGRPALHSFRVRFRHPVTEAEMRFAAPLPEDLKALLPAAADWEALLHGND